MREEIRWNIPAIGAINDIKLFRFSTITSKETIFMKGNINAICAIKLSSRLTI